MQRQTKKQTYFTTVALIADHLSCLTILPLSTVSLREKKGKKKTIKQLTSRHSQAPIAHGKQYISKSEFQVRRHHSNQISKHANRGFRQVYSDELRRLNRSRDIWSETLNELSRWFVYFPPKSVRKAARPHMVLTHARVRQKQQGTTCFLLFCLPVFLLSCFAVRALLTSDEAKRVAHGYIPQRGYIPVSRKCTREYASVYVRIQTRTTLGSPFLHFLSSFQRAHLHSRFRKERTNHISRTPRIAARKNQNWNGRPSPSVSFSFVLSLLYHQLRLVSAAANEQRQSKNNPVRSRTRTRSVTQHLSASLLRENERISAATRHSLAGNPSVFLTLFFSYTVSVSRIRIHAHQTR